MTEAEPQQDSGLNLAPVGADVLREEERTQTEAININTSQIKLAPSFVENEPIPTTVPPAPDTSHLDMGEVGEDIPHVDNSKPAVNPDTSHIALSPSGTDFSDCQADEIPLPIPDTSELSIAEQGDNILEEVYKSPTPPSPPDTTHIQLKNKTGV